MTSTCVARAVALGFLVLSACSTTRNVRPVGEKKFAAGLSVGGPFFTNLGPAYPTPLTSIYVRYGLDAKTDLDAAIHLPILPLVGVDAGAARLLVTPEGLRPALMAGGRLFLYANAYGLTGRVNPNGLDYGLGFRAFEELYATASWQPHAKVLVWAGLDLFVQAEHLTALPSAIVGTEYRPFKPFGVTLEVKQLAFTSNQRFAAVDFIGPADHGALALQLGFNFYPGVSE